MPLPPGRRFSFWDSLGPQDLLLSTTPFFHIMGYLALLESLFHHTLCVTLPEKPLSPDLIVDVIHTAKPTVALVPPSVLEEMSTSDRALDALSHLKQVFFGGAPLAPEAGDKISKVTEVVVIIGTSECGYIPTLQPEKREDWKYYEFNTDAGVELQPIGEDMYELVIKRGPTRKFQGVFHTFPELSEYHTKDVFIPHPTEQNKWTYQGRIDDVIVLSNGEKFNPVTMEKIIEGHPLVSRAVIAGHGRFQSCLLVEPNWHEWSEDKPVRDLIDSIWPVVQQANETGLAHGRVLKSKIGVASKAKPFKITPKGTTQRQHVYRDYAEEINSLYQKSDEDDIVSEQLPENADLAGIKNYIHKVVSSILGRAIEDKEDFFGVGLDSLQTVQLSRILQGAIRAQYPDKSSEAITTQKIYSNPTIQQLSVFVHKIISGDANGVADEASRAEIIESLVKKYTDDIPAQELNLQNPPDTHTVILTGSTGSLGNYLLSALLDDPNTVKVYCLNRSGDAASRQKKSFAEKGLSWDSNREAKVEFLQASFGAEKFGLDDSKYDEMLRSVDTIIHNAWKVDFNHSVSSFEDVHIRGVRRFVDFSLQSTQHAHIHFVSSVATIGAWNPALGPAVPEAPMENPDATLPQGYGESKHVSERICLAASRRAGVPTTVLRVGQVGGPTLEKGMWNSQEWLPTIVATSKTTGHIPTTLGSAPVDWIPVDTLATIIAELIQTRRQTQSSTRCTAFNLINPSATSWSSLIPAVQRYYPHIEPVSLATWVQELEQIKNPTDADVTAKPALKLLDFYRGLLTTEGGLSSPIEQKQTKAASATMRHLGPIDQPLMENWLRQWNF
jgi:thioester reductase-like protein